MLSWVDYARRFGTTLPAFAELKLFARLPPPDDDTRRQSGEIHPFMSATEQFNSTGIARRGRRSEHWPQKLALNRNA